MIVLKFGGTSVGNAEAIRKVKSIVENNKKPCIVVASAMGGVTNELISIFDTAVKQGKGFEHSLSALKSRHLTEAEKILSKERLQLFIQVLHDSFEQLHGLLKGLAILKDSRSGKDYVLSVGERISAKLLSLTIDNASYADSRDFIITDDHFGNANILWDETCQHIQKRFTKLSGIVVVPGFCGSTLSQRTTTLGRGGSDLTAAMIGAALKAERIEIWTDVNGMMTADPRIEAEAISLAALTYSEAAELCHFGAKVLYTPAIWPAIRAQVPVLIRNTFQPDFPGTLINAEGDKASARPVKGISYIPNVSLVTIYGERLAGQIGASHRLFGLLAANDINVVFISQASSEYSISFAVRSEDGERAVMLLKKEGKDIYNNVSIDNNMAILAIVGDNMRRTPGISGKMFSTLGKYGINVVAIAQGGSELNISAVVVMKDVKRAVNVMHNAFFLGSDVAMNIYLVGPGLVGNALAGQLKMQHSYILERYGINLKVKGIMNSRKMLFSKENLLDKYPSEWEKEAQQANAEDFLSHIFESPNPNNIFVDCTASQAVASLYDKLLENSISIATANKIAASGSYTSYKRLVDLARKNGCSFRYETNVGAGLPLLETIEDMVKSGDKIVGIEAVLSGSLNFILNKVKSGISLIDAIHDAHKAGFTEPDPRIDLSGKDVKRKLLILSRVAGYSLEDEDIIENAFLPPSILKVEKMDVFYKEVDMFGRKFEKRVANLSKENKCLRYIASFKNGIARIGLEEVESTHPFYLLDDSNNIVTIYSNRYNEHPLTIRGYGAGAEVTAAGVFADIMKIALSQSAL